MFKKIATVNIPEEPNAENSNNLYKIASKFKFNAIDSKNVKSALSKFSDKKKKIIVIFGSLYLAGHVLSIN